MATTITKSVGSGTAVVKTGTLNAKTPGDYVLVGSGTSFTTEYSNGDTIVILGTPNQAMIISTVDSNTQITLTSRIGYAFSNGTTHGKAGTQRDYPNISAFLAACPASLVTADQAWVGELYADSVFAPFSVPIKTSDATRFITIKPAVGHKHDGRKFDNTKVCVVAGEHTTAMTNNTGTGYFTNDGVQIGININGNGFNFEGARLWNSIVYGFDHVTWSPASGGYLYGGNAEAVNNIVYGKLASHGIHGNNGAKIYNNTVRGGNTYGIRIELNTTYCKNNISINSVGLNYYNPQGSTNVANNISRDDTAPGTGSILNANPSKQVLSLIAGSEDFRINRYGDSQGVGTDLSTLFTKDISGATRRTPWSIGAWATTLQTRIRSLGTKTAYNTGIVSTDATGLIVTLGGGGTFDANWGEGDRIDFSNAAAFSNAFSSAFNAQAVGYVLTRDSSTQITLQEAITPNLSGVTYSISRAYSTIASWYSVCPDLVTTDQLYKGVGYSESAFTNGAIFSGNVTDSTRYIWLTAAVGHRHSGKRYTTAGARCELSTYASYFVGIVNTTYTLLEWWQCQVNSDRAFPFSNDLNYGTSTTVRNNIFTSNRGPGGTWSTDGAAMRIYYGTAYNNIIYGYFGGSYGHYAVHVYRNATVYNNTVYQKSFETSIFVEGIYGGVPYAQNNMALGGSVCFSYSGSPVSDHNLSTDATATGTGSLINKVAADQCISLTAGSEDFTLKTTADAANAGTDLHTIFVNDVANKTRYASWINRWDIGASRPFTVITRTIGTSARDYTTIANCLAACPASLTAEDIVWKGECYNDSIFDVTVGTVLTNTTDATRYLWITAATGQGHDGKRYTTSGVRLEQGAGHDLNVFTSGDIGLYGIIENLQFKPYGYNNALILTGNPSNLTVRNCIFYDATWGSNVALDLHSAGDVAYNNVIYGSGFSSGMTVYRASLYNNTVYGCTIGINSPAVNVIAKNNICAGNGTDFGGTYYTSSSNNLSSDATAPGSSPQINKAAVDQFFSITAGSEDFELLTGSAAVGNGADLSSIFTTDITG